MAVVAGEVGSSPSNTLVVRVGEQDSSIDPILSFPAR